MQLYGLLAVALVAGCYVLCRRGQGWVAAALLGLGEIAVTAGVAWRHDVAVWLLGQGVLGAGVWAALIGAYRRLRAALLLRGWAQARDAQLRERARIAADLHDTLGHELTLLSLQAAAIQVKAQDPEIRERAAALRSGAAQAIVTTKGLVDLLGPLQDGAAAGMIGRARAAGMRIEVSGEPPLDEETARVLGEALANAATHAPGQPVSVAFQAGSLVITNPVGAAPLSGRPGTGLATLTARLAENGGRLTFEQEEGTFRLRADGLQGNVARPDIAADFEGRRRRAHTVLIAAVIVAACAFAGPSTAYYAWATHGRTMEPEAYAKLHVGLTESAARTLLPRRQAYAHPGARPGCEYYTDANWPLAYGNYEICFTAGRISALHNSTGGNG